MAFLDVNRKKENQYSLREAVMTIRSGSERIYQSALEISNGNSDLSSRTKSKRQRYRKLLRVWSRSLQQCN